MSKEGAAAGDLCPLAAVQAIHFATLFFFFVFFLSKTNTYNVTFCGIEMWKLLLNKLNSCGCKKSTVGSNLQQGLMIQYER